MAPIKEGHLHQIFHRAGDRGTKYACKIIIFFLLAPTVLDAALVPSATTAAPTVALRFNGEQYQINTTTYDALIPPTGLLTYVEMGKHVFLDDSINVNVGQEWNAPSQHICAAISQPKPDTLVCSGRAATLTYTFGPDSIDLSVTSQTDPLKLFLNLTDKNEGVLSDSSSKGQQVALSGERAGAYGLSKAQFYGDGQLMEVSGADTLYGLTLLRLDVPARGMRTMRLQMRSATDAERTNFSIPALYASPMSVLSPQDWQVFQRQTVSEGCIRISGRLKVVCDRVQFRRDEDPWQNVLVDPVSGDFSTQVTAPAGGWYRCQLRALKGNVTVASKTVEHVGVGEVFVGAGQSNSTNYGDERQHPTSGLVSTFSGVNWRPADDPQPGVHDASDGGSFWPAFGDAMAERFKVPIGVAVTGQGATSVAEWIPGSELFNWMESRILQLGPQGFRMVLWHQGESDGSMPSQEYADRLVQIIEQSNIQARWSFPWMIARVCNTNGQDLVIAQGAALAGPSTDLLQGDYRGHPGNTIHFSAKGLQKHGLLWADKVSVWLDTLYPGTTEEKP